LNKEDKDKIERLVDTAYSKLIDVFNYQESTPNPDDVYRSMNVIRGDSTSYLNFYMTYYMGAFEGLLLNSFLEKFEEYPNLEQKTYIQDSFTKRYQNFVNVATKYAEKNAKKDL